jgi:nucleotide-binding universal stress UspA family protein
MPKAKTALSLGLEALMQKKILVAVDGTPCSENAACIAFAMARRMGATVVLCSVVLSRGKNSSDWGQKYFLEAKKHALELLQRWAKVGESGWEIAVDFKLLSGEHIAEEIVKYAESDDFDFLIIGTHGRTGVDYTLLGSVAERVSRRSSIPVMIARRADTDPRWQLGEIEEIKTAQPAKASKGESHV